MPYIYKAYAALDGIPVVGTRQCVALLQHFMPSIPNTAVWKEGAKVRGNTSIQPGTAIATFVNGRYPSQPHGNHAAFYVRQDSHAIYVVDQWKKENKTNVNLRPIRFLGKDHNGHYPHTSDNGDAFSIIE